MKVKIQSNDFEKDYENTVIKPVNREQSAKRGRYVFWHLDLSDIILIIALGFLVIASIMLAVNNHDKPSDIPEGKIVLFFISMLALVAAMIFQYIYTTYVVYNRDYYRECQASRLEKAEPLLKKWGYCSIESLQAMAQRYQNDKNDAKEASSGKWELFFLLNNSIVTVTSMMWNDEMTQLLLNPLFMIFISGMFIVPVIVSIVRKVCYDILWPKNRQYILSDVLVLIENRLRVK